MLFLLWALSYHILNKQEKVRERFLDVKRGNGVEKEDPGIWMEWVERQTEGKPLGSIFHSIATLSHCLTGARSVLPSLSDVCVCGPA